MSDGAYKLIGGNKKVLGYVLVKKGQVTSFTPHGLKVAGRSDESGFTSP